MDEKEQLRIQFMDNDFGGSNAQTYRATCQCGQTIEVSSQILDKYFEYMTAVFVRCQCGRSVFFHLPVG